METKTKFNLGKNIYMTNFEKITMIGNLFAVEYNIKGHDAYTLNEKDIGNHKDGWTIVGKIHEDYFAWVNEFDAVKGDEHIFGDFEKVVFCTSLEALDDFLENHNPTPWDYWDI